jgi:hypothetical protein
MLAVLIPDVMVLRWGIEAQSFTLSLPKIHPSYIRPYL